MGSITIGNFRQLFFDDYFIKDMQNVSRKLHSPVFREIVLSSDSPADKASAMFMVVLKDDGKYKAWYRCDHIGAPEVRNPRHAAYAESKDGIHWEKPSLGLFEINGSKDNNLVWMGPGSNLAPFIDSNPNVREDQRYKAIIRTSKADQHHPIIGTSGGLDAAVYGLVSPDGIHWNLIQDTPILTEGPFDSFNIPFWDPLIQEYVIYTRGIGGVKDSNSQEENIDIKSIEYGKTMWNFFGGVRWIRRSTSKDFINWTPLQDINTGDTPFEHLYTNSCTPYHRAPNIYLMFPSRYVIEHTPDNDWIHGEGVNDIVLMSSRDGINFDRTFMEGFIRPGLDIENWHERGVYMEKGILQTSDNEMSMYLSEHIRYPSSRIRRLTIRTDGFVSVNSGFSVGEFISHDFILEGDQLELNYSTSAAGYLKAELQDLDGTPIPGFSIQECPEKFGDEIDGIIKWNNKENLRELLGKSVRLKVALKDADLFSLKFLK